jgi:hypothetical protein
MLRRWTACGPAREKDNEAMSGIQFVTDEKGRKVGVLIGSEKTRGNLGGLLGGLSV